MKESLRAQVGERAGDRCEYCHLPQATTILPHEADHIRSQKHNGAHYTGQPVLGVLLVQFIQGHGHCGP
jgi:hypothetical protein